MKLLAPLLISVSILAGCNGGGTGTAASPAQSALKVTTTGLQSGNVGFSYYDRLQASGGEGPYTWWVSSTGDPLPDGLQLTSDGQIAGTPTKAAVASLVLVVQDKTGAFDLATRQIEVRDVEITPKAPASVVPGDALAFTAAGGAPSYAFSFLTNGSAGTLTTQGAYTAGQNSAVDVIRATDADGFFDQVAVTVGDNPFAGFQAVYSTTDVWWVHWDVVYNPSQTYASDYDEALSQIGLRHTSSTDATGTEEDRLARDLVERRTLGYLSTYYENGFDGNPLPGGLAISFVGPSGPTTGTTPATGGIEGAAPDRYSTICVRYGGAAGVVGTAWLDSGNGTVECDCGDPNGTSLGVFVNHLVGPFLSVYGNELALNPINSGDVDALKALLSGQTPQDARGQLLFDTADNFSRILAAVLAHEIGHSLGLGHSNPSGGNWDIMNASLSVSPGIQYHFNATHLTQLHNSLPGPNR